MGISSELYEFIVKVVEDKVRDIKVTREEFDRLVSAVNRLAEAQRRTEETIAKLIQAVDTLRREVGRLSEVVGFGLEDIARVVLPGWLHRHLGVEVDELERRFFNVDGREVEVNLYGEGRRGDRKVVVLGECRSRIYGRDVRKFYEEVYLPVSSKIGKEAVGVMFGYLIHPSAKKMAEELGLYVVASYQR